MVANSGSVGWPVDRDWRPSYLIFEGDQASVRRVEYDLERELAELRASRYPTRGWKRCIARRSSSSPLPWISNDRLLRRFWHAGGDSTEIEQ